MLMQKKPFLVYDLMGAALVCGVAALGVWSGCFHLQASSAHLQRTREKLVKTGEALADAESVLRREQLRRTQLADDIARRGALPQRSPVEDDLRDIALIARDSHVELVQVSPLASEQYPGLVELRYTVQTRGRFDGLLGFLRAFERSTLWADITSLEIGGGGRETSADEQAQNASLVLSLFAAQGTEGAPQAEARP
jgi:hypothetical protein